MVLRELLSMFGASDPLRDMGENFNRMLALTHRLNLTASQIYFNEIGGNGETERAALFEQDAQVNALEQTIRRQIITHLSFPGNEADVPYSLLLMTLVKDVERLGDYAKNLAQLTEIRHGIFPLGPELDELLSIRRGVERIFFSAANVFKEASHDEALKLIRDGRIISRKCDRFIYQIGTGSNDAGTTTALILGTRFYKRICGHLLNVLTSVVMPLDKVDYYDEALDPSVSKDSS